jgi:nuclear pore complex protein Nup85
MQVENGLVETIAVLISKMPRLRPSLPPGSPGQAFNFKPEFTKASARWLWAEDHGHKA